MLGFEQETFCCTLLKFCIHSNGHAEIGAIGLGVVTIDTFSRRKNPRPVDAS